MAHAPAGVCHVCEEPTSALVGEALYECSGQCKRTYHASCCAPSAAGCCAPCVAGTWACSACGKAGSMQKCSMSKCGRFYHMECVKALPRARLSALGKSFRCPVHYCGHCGASGDSIPMVGALGTFLFKQLHV